MRRHVGSVLLFCHIRRALAALCITFPLPSPLFRSALCILMDKIPLYYMVPVLTDPLLVGVRFQQGAVSTA